MRLTLFKQIQTTQTNKHKGFQTLIISVPPSSLPNANSLFFQDCIVLYVYVKQYYGLLLYNFNLQISIHEQTKANYKTVTSRVLRFLECPLKLDRIGSMRPFHWSSGLKIVCVLFIG